MSRTPQTTVERMTFRRAPLAAAAVWFGTGIVVDRFREPPLLVLGVLLILLAGLAAAALIWAKRVGWIPLMALWIVTGVSAAKWQPAPANPGELLRYADGLSRRVVGRVTRLKASPQRNAASDNDRDPVPWWELTEETRPSGERAQTIDLALLEVEDVTPDTATMVKLSGGLRVTAYGNLPELVCGDLVETTLRLKMPERYRDPGVWQYADYLLEQGIASRASAGAERIRRIGAGPQGWSCRMTAAQSWAVNRLEKFIDSSANRRLPAAVRLGGVDADVLDAMLFGDRAELSRTMRLGFERTGSFHLFVVSGLHVALLAGAVFWALQRLHTPPWAATLGTITAAGGYAMLTGFGQPVQRALVMTSIFLVGKLLIRHGSSMNALGAAALAMMVWKPGCVFEASFQMTVLAIVAIAGLAVPLGEWSFTGYARGIKDIFAPGMRGNVIPRVAQFRVMLRLFGDRLAWAVGGWARRWPARIIRVGLLALELAVVGAVAELVMVLPMAMYFHRAAVFALPANMVVIPILGLLAPAAVLTFAGSLVNPWLAVVPGAITAFLVHGVSWMIGRLSHLSAADVRVPGPVWWIAILATAAWAGCCWAVRRGRWGAWGVLFLVPVVALMVLWPERPMTVPGALEITAIDVGQGDSLLVTAPGGGAMLVDAGGPVGQHGAGEVNAHYDVGEEVVSPYLWSRRIRRLDVVVLTHAHTDHMGGMPAVLRNFRPHELWLGVDPASPLYADLLQEARQLDITIRHLHAGETFGWQGIGIQVLAPAVGYRNPGTPKNDDSLVLRLDYGRGSALLEGDAEKQSEETMLSAGLIRPATLLKIGHHGSMTSTTPEFLAAVAPKDAVISVGLENTFGHPRGEVIARVATARTKLYRTDEFGLITFLLREDGQIQERMGVR